MPFDSNVLVVQESASVEYDSDGMPIEPEGFGGSFDLAARS
jgi:hypothetical protein